VGRVALPEGNDPEVSGDHVVVAELDSSARAVHACAIGQFGRQRRADRRLPPCPITEDGRDCRVYICRGEGADRGDGDVVIEKRRGQSDRIDPQVEQRAATERPVIKAMFGVGGIESEPVIGEDGDDLSDRARVDNLAKLAHVRQESRPHGLHDEDAVTLGQFEQLFRLPCVQGEGLLDEDGLACTNGELGHTSVLAVRHSNVYVVDIRVGNEFFVRAIRTHRTAFVGERLGLRDVP
jgi:hypothetical protein